MRPILTLLSLLVLTLPCHAQGDKAKPNTLTPKEIADGWLLLFDGETTFGWKIDGEAKVEKGMLILGGSQSVTARTTTPFGMYRLSVEFTALQGKEPTRIKVCEAESLHTLPTLNEIGFYKGGVGKPGKATDPIVINVPAGSRIAISNAKLQPFQLKSIFNGKDLAGWKEFPGKKSKFAIVDGAINVKDGPGDLQTVGKYKDFVLQFDCISNGTHLNSGIFFRCRDNEYQNGYEAQIRNEFKAEPQKYLVEEYDPKTNMLIAKKEVLSNAFDFGTGAIYRRVPARKQMSKDNEWFTMTIAAHGNHLATWVNGVQMTDWTDNRPKSDNARTGQKLDAGHISIQGHDPTTDLSFKSFRIAELK